MEPVAIVEDCHLRAQRMETPPICTMVEVDLIDDLCEEGCDRPGSQCVKAGARVIERRAMRLEWQETLCKRCIKRVHRLTGGYPEM